MNKLRVNDARHGIGLTEHGDNRLDAFESRVQSEKLNVFFELF